MGNFCSLYINTVLVYDVYRMYTLIDLPDTDMLQIW